jgi:hypothetical protein
MCAAKFALNSLTLLTLKSSQTHKVPIILFTLFRLLSEIAEDDGPFFNFCGF